MSNLVVDDVLFYHGGAADLGVNVEVTQNFGPVNSCSIGRDTEGDKLNPTRAEKSALQGVHKDLAKKAKKLGANAIICHSHSTSFIAGFSDSLQCVTSAHGDAVTLTPKET
ncbi:MAG: hypothetical protein OSB62_02535 [Alphaproteobacteria bacterium]|nr:hypothetical protein [Alphaproteobacteria bacterium]